MNHPTCPKCGEIVYWSVLHGMDYDGSIFVHISNPTIISGLCESNKIDFNKLET